MNILISELPVSVEIGGERVPINTDFRASLAILMTFQNPMVTNFERQQVLIHNLYVRDDIVPLVVYSNMDEAMEKAQWFLDGGQVNKSDDINSPSAFSFDKDAQLIYAAFRQTHGINLQTSQLHWWEFLALFMDLGADTAFCGLTSLRKRVKTGKASKEERKMAREMGEIFDVPEMDTRSLEEKDMWAELARTSEKARANRKMANEQKA